MNDFLQRLKGIGRQRVELEDLRAQFHLAFPETRDNPERGQLLLATLRQLEQDGHLKLPVIGKRGWEGYGQPPLPLWAQLASQAQPRNRRDWRAIAWAPELGFWTDLTPSQLEALVPINDFLLRRRGPLVSVPVKERSLEIFGDEKRLGLMGASGLVMGKLPLSTLGCFHVAAPLAYRPAVAPGKPVLVVENKDTYWSFGEWNAAERMYAAVVYGQGEAFHSTGAALDQVLRETGAPAALYFGDLDPKGVNIPLQFNGKASPGRPHVAPAAGLYEWLLAHGRTREKSECSNAPASLAASWLPGPIARGINALWRDGLWLPQEALGFEQLRAGHIQLRTLSPDP